MKINKVKIKVSKGKEIIVCKGDANRIGEIFSQK